jgi:hypothetical protein
MRALAIIGLVALLALVAWIVVQGVRFFPRAGESMSAAVTSVTSVFHPAPAESLTLSLPAHTLAAGGTTTVSWTYTGNTPPTRYDLSYNCTPGVVLSVKQGDTFTVAPCDTLYTVEGTDATILPASTVSRFADVTLSVTAGALTDSTVVTIVNTDIGENGTTTALSTKGTVPTASSSQATAQATAPTTGAPTAKVITRKPIATSSAPTTAPTTSSAPTAQVTPAPRPYVPPAPADLVVQIKQTGVQVPMNDGTEAFFPISPIPSDKTAAVRFTVTNRGGLPSGAWSFVATLPVEGDPNYRFVSSVQDGLAPDMQVEFTLGFDEVRRAQSGIVSITLVPESSTDNPLNNVDTAQVAILPR